MCFLERVGRKSASRRVLHRRSTPDKTESMPDALFHISDKWTIQPWNHMLTPLVSV